MSSQGLASEPEADFNDILDDIVLGEEREEKASYEEGFKAGRLEGNPEGYHLGYHRGAELGVELGYYLGVVTHHLTLNKRSETPLYTDKIVLQLEKVKQLIGEFPRINSEDHDILGTAETIRAQYKRTCALLKIDSKYPFDGSVEFLTQQLWRRLVPADVRAEVESQPLTESLERFWGAAEAGTQSDVSDTVPGGQPSELARWVRAARARHLRADGETCLTNAQARRRVGGRAAPDLPLDQFFSPKKGYEVREMWPLVSALRGSHCVELGGGRGYLGEAAARVGGRPALTVDCDAAALRGGRRRADRMQRVLSKSADSRQDDGGRHRYANLFVDESTDLLALVRDSFPEDFADGAANAVDMLITGLHTCGDLGPDSLRIFAREPAARALCNVPCCYHLLSEAAAPARRAPGFPVSRYLARSGYKLGRNARMLASQSLERACAAQTTPSVGLHYRAVLQIVLKEHLPDARIAEGRLKGVATKCQNFADYYKMAVKKLNLEKEVQLTDDLTVVEGRYECHRKSLVIFYLLRLCLAQVVESLILLDRLLFMVEKGFEDVFLVKLFDPSKSPRCHAIVAMK